MKVEIWSDVMCPFCYIGKKHFEEALAQLPFKDQIEVEWKSFQLDPSLPLEGASVSTAEYLEKRKGYPRQQIDSMLAHLKQSGAQAGIEFNQEKAIPVNTFRAHRLIHFAQQRGKGNDMEEALFHAHFTGGQNVGDVETLATLAAETGLDKKEVTDFLHTEAQTEAVNKDIEEAQQLGISGVPFFVLDRKYAVSGAQPVAAFVGALTQAFEESRPKFEMKGDPGADACGPDGCAL